MKSLTAIIIVSIVALAVIVAAYVSNKPKAKLVAAVPTTDLQATSPSDLQSAAASTANLQSQLQILGTGVNPNVQGQALQNLQTTVNAIANDISTLTSQFSHPNQITA